MTIKFSLLEFEIIEEKICLSKVGDFTNGLTKDNYELYNFVEVHIAGKNKPTHMGVKTAFSSEFIGLKYDSHNLYGNFLEIVQKSENIEVKSVFEKYENCNCISVKTTVTNISKEDLTIEEVASFCVTGMGSGINSVDELYLTEFYQSHHIECQVRTSSFKGLGLYTPSRESQKKILFANVGSWSTKERLPQLLIENKENKTFMFLQIESNNSWFYEISDKAGVLYLNVGSANLTYCGWAKSLKPNQVYTTVTTAFCVGNSNTEVIEEISRYRKNIKGTCLADESLPTIFNEYMHLSWDNPTAEKTKIYAPKVAQSGVEYYVIDCGWHNEEDGNIIYPYVGQWKESKKRFPDGIRATTDYIRSLGMKAGLWIEPEIIGIKCQEMLNFYDDDCFISRFGKKVAVMGRYFLDFRNKKVRLYMKGSIRRMVEEYGAEYIKMDYNQDLGLGTDKNSNSFGEGLEQCSQAYLSWIDEIREEFPNVIFETCSSGGMRMDYKTLSKFSIVSTSDQPCANYYPYIVGNIFSAVLPEQAAVWSYPVSNSCGVAGFKFEKEYIEQNLLEEDIVINMVNGMLGRMHLASDLTLLNDKQFELVKEGVAYYKSIVNVKKNALPFLPLGFTNYGEDFVCTGLKHDNRIYLAIWNLKGDFARKIQLEKNIYKVKIGYPKQSNVRVSFKNNVIDVCFTKERQAIILEIQTE